MVKRISIVILFSCSLFGQVSYYSTYGFGLSSPAVGSRFLGLGQTGVAIPDSLSLNTSNPALWDGFITTSIQGNLGSSAFTTTTEYPGSQKTQYTGFSVKFPIGKEFGFAMGLMPVTRMRGEISITDSTGFFDDMVSYSADMDVEGGISEFFLGTGYRLNPAISLGVSLHLYFGSYLTRLITDIDNDDSNNTYNRKYTVIEGSQLEWGSYFAGPRKKFELGATITHNLKSGYYHYVDYNYGDDSTFAFQPLTFPMTFKIGIRQKIGNSLAFSSDFAYSRVPESLFQDFWILEQSASQDPIYIGVGLEKLPVIKVNSSLMEKLSFRAGAFYKTEAVNQTGKISEQGVSFGVGVPFNHYSNRIDLAVVASVRDGFLSDTIGKEKLISFYASVTAGELWFKRFKRF